MRDRKGTWMLVAASALLATVPAASGSAQATGSDSSRARGTASAGSWNAGGQANGQQCAGGMGAASSMGASGSVGARGSVNGMRGSTSSAAGSSSASGQNRTGSALPSGMTDANILAHMAMGDSLEIQMGQCALSQAQNSQVRDFAQTLVSDHTASLQHGQSVAQQAGITPQLASGDTMMSRMGTMNWRGSSAAGNSSGTSSGSRGSTGRDSTGGAMGANRSTRTTGTTGTSRSSGTTPNSANSASAGTTASNNSRSSSSNGSWAGGNGAMSDRAFVQQQVALHQQMINELQSLRSSAQSSAVQQHIDTVLPVMQRHLARARELQQSLRGGNGQGTGASRQP